MISNVQTADVQARWATVTFDTDEVSGAGTFEVRARYLGKKGSVAGVLRTLGQLEPEQQHDQQQHRRGRWRACRRARR